MRLVVMCCLCEKVYDDVENEAGKERWKERKWYLARHMLRPADIRFSHSYCPDCLESYRAFLRLPQGDPRASQKEGKA